MVRILLLPYPSSPCCPSRLLLEEIPQQHISACEVAALPCAQGKPHRPPGPVTDHRSLLIIPHPFGTTDQSGYTAPLLWIGMFGMGLGMAKLPMLALGWARV